MQTSSYIREKRRHRRLDLRLPFDYAPAVMPHANASANVTINISTGGLYFETADMQLQVGDDLEINLTVPTDDDRLPPHAHINTLGRVVRISNMTGPPNRDRATFPRFGVAAEFQRPLKLRF